MGTFPLAMLALCTSALEARCCTDLPSQSWPEKRRKGGLLQHPEGLDRSLHTHYQAGSVSRLCERSSSINCDALRRIVTSNRSPASSEISSVMPQASPPVFPLNAIVLSRPRSYEIQPIAHPRPF